MELLINIDVDDLEKAVAFYQAALDLRLGRRLFGGSIIEMLGGSSKIYLLAKPSGSSASASAPLPRDYQRHWTPVHLDLSWKIFLPRCSAPQRPERLAVMSDPFGHGFCLLQFSDKGYDEVA